jgi:pimeloyl-ACP methyl ester carboxylesterase
VVVPDLRGFGGSDKHAGDPAVAYSAHAPARSGERSPAAWPGARQSRRTASPSPPPFSGRTSTRSSLRSGLIEWGLFSDATVRVVRGAGHFTPLEAPQEFASAIEDAVRAGDYR